MTGGVVLTLFYKQCKSEVLSVCPLAILSCSFSKVKFFSKSKVILIFLAFCLSVCFVSFLNVNNK